MDLKECIKTMEAGLSGSELDKFRTTHRENLIRFHHGLGAWVRNSCFLWSRGGLDKIIPDIKKLVENGITLKNSYTNEPYTVDTIPDHPDDISIIIMEIYHDILNDKIHNEEVDCVDMFIVNIIPYLHGKYFGDDVLEWLKENMEDDQYQVIKHPLTVQLSSQMFPTRFAFRVAENATAFKLRWS